MLQTPETMTPETKRQECLRIAVQLFSQSPDWVTFFREILGIEGVARRLFKTQEEYLVFEQSKEFADIQAMVSKLRSRNASGNDGQEPTRVITVRLPKSLHEALRAEAHDHKTSMNKLCIAKLLQVLAEEEANSAAANANAAAAQLAARSTTSALAPTATAPATPAPVAAPRPVTSQPTPAPQPTQSTQSTQTQFQRTPSPTPQFGTSSLGTTPNKNF